MNDMSNLKVIALMSESFDWLAKKVWFWLEMKDISPTRHWFPLILFLIIDEQVKVQDGIRSISDAVFSGWNRL